MYVCSAGVVWSCTVGQECVPGLRLWSWLLGNVRALCYHTLEFLRVQACFLRAQALWCFNLPVFLRVCVCALRVYAVQVLSGPGSWVKCHGPCVWGVSLVGLCPGQWVWG